MTEEDGSATSSICGMDALRQFYDRATVLVLALVAENGSLRNVNTTIIYGTSNVVSAQSSSATVTSRRDESIMYRAFRAVISAADADAFVEAAKTGTAALLPFSASISYDLAISYPAFMPRGDFAKSTYEQMPGSMSSWRMRYSPDKRALNGRELDKNTAAGIAAQLPKIETIDFELLNLDEALDRLTVLDVVYPTHVKAHFSPRDNGLHYVINDPHSWLNTLGAQTLSIECSRLGMLTDVAAFTPIAEDAIPIARPDAFRFWLSAGGLLLDAGGGTWIRQAATAMGITEAAINVSVGSKTVKVPVAPRQVSTINVGESDRPVSIFSYQHVAAYWRDQIRRNATIDERIFQNNAEECRARGIGFLAEMATQSRRQGTVRVVDPYGLDAEALMAMAAIAAGTPHGEIWILSNNYEASPTPPWERLLREIRKVLAFTSRRTVDELVYERFSKTAANISKRLGVPIRWYKPSISLHDRFLQIGDRIWHVGHSFNRFGCDLSAIVEFRNADQLLQLNGVLDEQFVDGNLKGTF